MANMCWSNNPNDLGLEVYFDKSQPNMADDYGVGDLQQSLERRIAIGSFYATPRTGSTSGMRGTVGF
jgi:hypothetical protein